MAKIRNRDPLLKDPVADQNALDELRPEGSTFETAQASFRLSFMGTASNLAIDTINRAQAEASGGPLIPPEELNEKYPDIETPFTAPLNQASVDLILDKQAKKRKLSEKMAQGPKGFIGGTAIPFVAALLPHAMDPIEIVTGKMIGSTVAKFGQAAIGANFIDKARKASKAARATEAARKAVKRSAFVRDAAEGIIGNVAIEPFIAGASRNMQEDYDAADFFTSVIGGGVVFPGAIHGAKAVYHKRGKVLAHVQRLGPKHVNKYVTHAVNRLGGGKKVRADVLTDELVDEVFSGSNPKTGMDYEFKTLDDVEFPKNKMFMSGATVNTDISKSRPQFIGEDYGNGVYLTDNPNIANNAAARHTNDSIGSVHEIGVEDARLFDLSKSIEENREFATEVLEPVIGKQKTKSILKNSSNFKDVYDALTEEALEKEDIFEEVASKFQEAGFDGIRYVSDRFLEKGHDPHNMAVVFDPKKVNTKQSFKADQGLVPGPDPEKVNALQAKTQSIESDFHYDEAEFREFLDVETDVRPAEVREFETAVNEKLEEVEALENLGILDEADKEKLEAIRVGQKDNETEGNLIKEAFACVRSKG